MTTGRRITEFPKSADLYSFLDKSMPLKPVDVDQYLESGCGRCSLGGTPQCKVHTWKKLLPRLRKIILAAGLTEEIKWGVPCYTSGGRNILILSAFTERVTVSFFRGAELTDPEGLLEMPGENSRYARLMSFTKPAAVDAASHSIEAFIREAVRLEKAGKKQLLPTPALDYPEELRQAFDANADFEKAFTALTPGRQRGYILHFSSAKKSATVRARIEKCKPAILQGKGWSER